ncbi:MAG: ATP-dependent zinc metalloprotease FtsH [Acidimicrobiia bacterium]
MDPLWRRPIFWVAMAIPTLLALYVVLLVATLPEESGREISFSELRQRMLEREVTSAVYLDHDNRVLLRSGGEQLWSALPNNVGIVNTFLQTALDQGIAIEADSQSVKKLLVPGSYVVPGLLFVSVVLFTHLSLRGRGFGKSRQRRKATDRSVTFADVAGNDDAVAEVRELRDFLMHPERLREIGAQPPKGILLVGPPGTGKTLLARAIAGEAGVPFFSISGTDFVEMFVGVGAARVRDIFKQVRESAPAILFIDELDAAGKARSGAGTAEGSDERDQTLNQLLVEMDGFDQYSGVVLIGATNRPDVLDPALLRRGRFDRQVVVDRPDRAGRVAILRVHSKGKHLAPGVDLDAVAARTPGFTGADLASMMNEAALLAARRNLPAIGVQELEEAADRVLAGNERARLLTPEEKRAVAYHEAGHAIVAWAVPGSDPVSKISVVARGQALGMTWMVPEEERFLVTKTELLGRMAVSLGGMAAEELVLGETTSGPRADLRKVSAIARQMVCELGMSESLGRLALGRQLENPYLGGDMFHRDFSETVALEIDREMRRASEQAYALAYDILVANRQLLDSLAADLVEQETIRQPELSAYAGSVVRTDKHRTARGREGRLAVRGLPAPGQAG